MRGFLPSTGRLVVVPAAGADAASPATPQAPGRRGVRVDTGVYEGGEIPIHYDSMICKLIACGADRAAAIATMREALNGFVIRGVSSNLAFQAALLGHPRFAAGDFNTGFIAEEFANGFDPRRDRASRTAISCSRSPPPSSAACWRDRPASPASCAGHELQARRAASSSSSRRPTGNGRETPVADRASTAPTIA